MTEKFDLIPNKLLGRHYRILEFLGNGWEGEVYKVEERQTGVIRAAKLFYDRNGSIEAPHISYAKRLYNLRFCPIVIQYHHQDIAYINQRKINFLVSDFVSGEVLSQYIKKQRSSR